MNNKIYNVLIVGAGDIGAGYDFPDSKTYLTHAHAFKDHYGFHLVGFVEPNKEIRMDASEKWDVDCFESINEAFVKFSIDIVSIAVPDQLHFQVLKEVAKHQPKFVLAEKPLTQTLEEASEIVNLYKEIPSVVNFKRRFTPEIIKLKEKISNNTFGEFRFGTSYYGKGFLHNGSHLINLLLYLLDTSWISFEKMDTIVDYKEEDASLSILLKSADSNRRFLIKSIDQNDFAIFDFDILFSKGRIRITDLGTKIEEYQVESNEVFKAFTTLEIKKSYRTKLNESLLYLVNHIYEYLTLETPLSCTFDEVYEEMKFTDKIIKSIENV